ncbi:MAG TPA: crosslink repair DNA glycosylase YcaQ family protein [Myxococcaceae bacterium]|jgi:hypothetical protein
MVTVTPRQIIAFRLSRSGLRRRTGELLAAVGELGLPDFPPGAAQAALAPRLRGASPDTLVQAFEQRALVRMRAMRGAPTVVRAEDLSLLAAGLLPPDEKSMRAFIGPALTSVKAAKLSALEAVERVTREVTAALARGPLDRDALHAELRQRVPKGLLPYCRGCDSHHVHPSLIYAVALAAPLVLFTQDEGPYLLARADRWLGGKAAHEKGREAPAAELLRRFLRVYGPSTVGDFAAWAGLGGGQPQAMWAALEHELVQVEVQSDHPRAGARPSSRWILQSDAKVLAAADPDTLGSVVRLLSPGDPLLQLRDRSLLVPDSALQKVVWKNLSPTGLALAGTDIIGLTRVQKKQSALHLTVELTGKASTKLRAAVEEEATLLAQARGASEVKTVWR